MAVMDALLLLPLLTLLSGTLLATAEQLPDSYVLLPLTGSATYNGIELPNGTALLASFSCAPTYASTACSGHGSCYLLLDSAANASQPFIQAAAGQPIRASRSSLDTYGIDDSTQLPTAVCVCDSGWSGRGDYINHSALDGDSCQVQQSVVTGLCITGIVLFSILAVIAIHRLLRWYVWHTASLLTPSIINQTVSGAGNRVSVRPSQSSEEDAKANGPIKHTAPQPMSPHNNTPSSASLDTPTGASVTGRPPAAAPTLSPNNTTRQTPHSRARTVLGASPIHYTTQAQRQALWRNNLKHITFVHPFCSLIVAGCVLAYYVLRLTTTHTIGTSYIMSALIYVQHQPFCIAISIGTANNLSLAATFTRTTTGTTGLSTVIRAAKRYLMGLCVYSCFGWLLVWFIPAFPDSQQTLSILVLVFGFLPDLLIGPISVTATRRITAALIRHLELLSAEQQNERRKAYKKLRSFAYIITALVAANGVFCLIFACSAVLRQAGMPLFGLAWHLTTFFILGVRLLLLRPPVRKGLGASVAVQPVSPVAAGTVGAVRGINYVDGRILVSPAHSGAAAAESVLSAAPTSKPPRSAMGGMGGLEEVGDGLNGSATTPTRASKRDSATGVMVESGFDS